MFWSSSEIVKDPYYMIFGWNQLLLDMGIQICVVPPIISNWASPNQLLSVARAGEPSEQLDQMCKMTQLFYLLNSTLKRVVYDDEMNRNKNTNIQHRGI